MQTVSGSETNGAGQFLALDIERVLRILPHRQPFLLIDGVESLHENEVVAIKCVTYNEPFFAGHFPGKPIMPGVLLIEALAQTAAVLIVENQKKEIGLQRVALTSVEKARFRRPVTPGLRLRLRLRKVQQRRLYYKFSGCVEVEGRVYMEALFSATVL